MVHRIAFRLLSLGVALLVARPARAQSAPACTAASPAANQLLREIVAAVNDGTPVSINRLITARWVPNDRGTGAALDLLGLWHWRSRRLSVQSTCATATPGTSYALVANELSEETDSVQVDVDATNGRVREVLVRGGARVPAPRVANDAALVAEVRRLAKRLTDADVFAGEVLVARNGTMIMHETFGFADLERRTPISIGKQYSNASIGKIFTATAIMQLVQQGRLRLIDTLGTLAPGLHRPRGVESITVQQLLSHTSGIDPQDDTLTFRPGTKWLYSNYAFNVLSDSVIGRIVGRPFYEHYAEAVFAPAGMRNTIRLVADAPLATMLPNYWVQFDSTGLKRPVNPMLQTIPAMGAGNWFTTAEDLFLFAEALRAGRLVPRSVVAEMRREQLPGAEYGLGVALWRGPGIWGHAGDLPGTDADLELYGDTGYVAVVLSNRNGVNDPIRRRIAALVRAGTPGGF